MTPSRLAEWAKRVTDIVLTAPGYEQAPALVAREIRRLMHEFDEQIEAGDEPLDYWLDAPTTPLPGAGMEPGQRCTYAEGHEARNVAAHGFDPDHERQWDTNRFLRDEKRCKHIEPASPLPTEPTKGTP